MDFRARVNKICAPLPGAVKEDPWGGGHDAWKVGDKMFATIGVKADGVSVKCADIESCEMLIDAGLGIKAPYFHKSWIRLHTTICEDDLKHHVEASYDRIRASLTKKKQAALAPRLEMES